MPGAWVGFAAKPRSSFFRLFLWVSPVSLKASLVAQMVKHPPAVWESWVRSLGQEDPLEKEMATHSSTDGEWYQLDPIQSESGMITYFYTSAESDDYPDGLYFVYELDPSETPGAWT